MSTLRLNMFCPSDDDRSWTKWPQRKSRAPQPRRAGLVGGLARSAVCRRGRALCPTWTHAGRCHACLEWRGPSPWQGHRSGFSSSEGTGFSPTTTGCTGAVTADGGQPGGRPVRGRLCLAPHRLQLTPSRAPHDNLGLSRAGTDPVGPSLFASRCISANYGRLEKSSSIRGTRPQRRVSGAATVVRRRARTSGQVSDAARGHSVRGCLRGDNSPATEPEPNWGGEPPCVNCERRRCSVRGVSDPGVALAGRG